MKDKDNETVTFRKEDTSNSPARAQGKDNVVNSPKSSQMKSNEGS